MTITLSTGGLSTLGNWRKIAASLEGEPNPATKWLDEKIKEQGEDAPVLADESQMLYVILSLLAGEP